MSQENMYTDLCKACFIKLRKPSKKDIKKIVMSDEKYQCDCCNRNDYVVEYIED